MASSKPTITEKNVTELRMISDKLYTMRDELEDLRDEDPTSTKLMYIVGQLTVKLEDLEDRMDELMNEIADRL